MKVWITRDALSKGISIKEGEPFDFDPTVLRVRGRYHVYGFKEGEWHTTESAAKAKAEQMRVEKIASLKKQIAKLEKMTFTPKEPQ